MGHSDIVPVADNFKDIQIFLQSFGKYQICVWRGEETNLKLGTDLIPFASLPPCLPMQSRNVQCVAFTPVPQEPSVNLKAPTSGYSLALFALRSAHR